MTRTFRRGTSGKKITLYISSYILPQKKQCQVSPWKGTPQQVGNSNLYPALKSNFSLCNKVHKVAILLDDPSRQVSTQQPMAKLLDFCSRVFEDKSRWWRSRACGEGHVPQLAEAEPGHGQPYHSLLGLAF